MIEIVPTVVPESLDDIIRIVEKYSSFAETLHIDVADGVFAPNTTWMPKKGDTLPPGMKYEIHMMVVNPLETGLAYAAAGAHSLIGHAEAFKTALSASDAFAAWRAAGVTGVQIAALFQTSLDELAPYVSISDYILLMTIISIGVQGIPFEEDSIERVRRFKALHREANIAVDGGVSEKNIARLAKAGATRFCVGSAISKSDNPVAIYRSLCSFAAGRI